MMIHDPILNLHLLFLCTLEASAAIFGTGGKKKAMESRKILIICMKSIFLIIIGVDIDFEAYNLQNMD